MRVKRNQFTKRATHHAAGYDFEAAADIIIPSIWKSGIKNGLTTLIESMGEKATAIDENN